MSEQIILRGAILLNEDEDTMAMIMMLATSLRDNTKYFRYNYANEIEVSHDFDFVVIADLDNIPQIQHYFQLKSRKVPRIVHLVLQEDLGRVDYAHAFPDVSISPIPQASLDELDITLNLDGYAAVMEELAAERRRQQAVSGA